MEQTTSWTAQQCNEDSCIDFQQQPGNISTRLLHWPRKKEEGNETVIHISTWELNPSLNSNIFCRGTDSVKHFFSRVYLMFTKLSSYEYNDWGRSTFCFVFQIKLYSPYACHANSDNLWALGSCLIAAFSTKSLVLICRRHTWDIAAGTVWGTVTAYVNIYWRIIIYPRHWPPVCLRSLSWVQLRKQAGDCRRLATMKIFHVNISADATYSSETIRSIFTGKMVENCSIRFAFRANLGTSAIHRRCAGDPLGQIARRTLSVATGDYVAGWLAGYENQAKG